MKKVICLLLATLLCCSVAACAPAEVEKDPKVLRQIYEIKDAIQGEDKVYEATNYTNSLSQYGTTVTEKKVGTQTTLSLGSQKLELTYKQTRLCDVGEPRVHQYTIQGTAGGMVSLRDDGTVQGIRFYPVPDINVLPQEDTASVLQKIKEQIDGWIDFSHYEKSSSAVSGGEDGTVGLYVFEFYNVAGDYMTDSVIITLRDDSREKFVISFEYRDMPELTEEQLRINEAQEEKILLMKLQDLYNTDKLQYLSHEVTSSGLCMCKGEVCMNYSIDVSLRWKENNQKDTYRIQLIIPLHLLVEE